MSCTLCCVKKIPARKKKYFLWIKKYLTDCSFIDDINTCENTESCFPEVTLHHPQVWLNVYILRWFYCDFAAFSPLLAPHYPHHVAGLLAGWYRYNVWWQLTTHDPRNRNHHDGVSMVCEAWNLSTRLCCLWIMAILLLLRNKMLTAS